MLQRLPQSAFVAINPAAEAGSVEHDTGANSGAKSGSDFFASVCKGVFGKDAGFALHIETGVPERSCYRYASGESAVPALVLRAILFSPRGEPFFNALMAGCTAQWWLDYQRHARMGAAADNANSPPLLATPPFQTQKGMSPSGPGGGEAG